jgi:hypothetical protein
MCHITLLCGKKSHHFAAFCLLEFAKADHKIKPVFLSVSRHNTYCLRASLKKKSDVLKYGDNKCRHEREVRGPAFSLSEKSDVSLEIKLITMTFVFVRD